MPFMVVIASIPDIMGHSVSGPSSALIFAVEFFCDIFKLAKLISLLDFLLIIVFVSIE